MPISWIDFDADPGSARALAARFDAGTYEDLVRHVFAGRGNMPEDTSIREGGLRTFRPSNG